MTTTTNLLRRLEKVEEVMNPPEAVLTPRIEVVFVRPDGTVSSRLMFGPGEPVGGRRVGPEEPDEDEDD